MQFTSKACLLPEQRPANLNPQTNMACRSYCMVHELKVDLSLLLEYFIAQNFDFTFLSSLKFKSRIIVYNT